MKPVLKLAAAAVLLAALLGASTPKPTIQQALDAIAARAPIDLMSQGAPGMAIAITDRTHLLRIITIGYANVAEKKPITSVRGRTNGCSKPHVACHHRMSARVGARAHR